MYFGEIVLFCSLDGGLGNPVAENVARVCSLHVFHSTLVAQSLAFNALHVQFNEILDAFTLEAGGEAPGGLGDLQLLEVAQTQLTSREEK